MAAELLRCDPACVQPSLACIADFAGEVALVDLDSLLDGQIVTDSACFSMVVTAHGLGGLVT